jgi:uncharacterized membrane protein YbhN (UPF0104 family)
MLGALILCAFVAAYALLRPESRSVTAWLERRFGHTALGMRLAPVLPLLRTFRTRPWLVLGALALSVANQLFMALSLLFLARILGFPMLTLKVLGLSTPLSLIINMMPFSPGGIGFGEAAFANINAWILPGENVLGCATAFLAFRLVILIVSLPGVLQIVWNRPARMAPQEESCGS